MMKAQVHPIFPETIAEFNGIGVDQKKLQALYDKQLWESTNAEDDPEKFLKISKNMQVLNDDKALKKIFVDLVNQYAERVMLYKNSFLMTTSWFTKTEKNKISVLHNQTGPKAEDVRAQLEKVLSSADFGASPQLGRFLRSVVDLLLESKVLNLNFNLKF